MCLCVFPVCVGGITWTRARVTVLLAESSQISFEPLRVRIEPPLPTDPDPSKSPASVSPSLPGDSPPCHPHPLPHQPPVLKGSPLCSVCLLPPQKESLSLPPGSLL